VVDQPMLPSVRGAKKLLADEKAGAPGDDD
jgi:hypothetical protein